MFQSAKRPYTAAEIDLHSYFASRAAKGSDLDWTYQQYGALREKCQRSGLRVCDFREFCNRVNLLYRTRIRRTHPMKRLPEPVCWPDKTRPADLKALLSSLDKAPIEG
jgi:hypothetical protein